MNQSIIRSEKFKIHICPQSSAALSGKAYGSAFNYPFTDVCSD
jgi:hypothetical protein